MRGRCEEREREQAEAAGGLTVLLAVTFLAFVNYAALLPVVPMWASRGGAASVAVGATTGGMMAATVATQMGMPWLMRIFRLRTMMVVGSILLGGPTPMYLLSAEFTPIMLITVLRGVGFAFVVTAGATLVADLAGTGRLASSVSLYGVAAALPNLGALAGGVWIAEVWGYDIVFWASGAACLCAAALACALPTRQKSTFRIGSVADVQRVATPVTLFVLTAAAFGAVTTFLPLTTSPWISSSALLGASIALVVGRLAAGYIGDRYGAGRVLVASAWAGAVGVAVIALSVAGDPAQLIAGASLLGAAFGACQNDSFVVTIERLGRHRSGTASTIWNIAYDGGLGLGAVALGAVVGQLGYSYGFFAMAGVIAAAMLLRTSRRGVPRGRRESG